MSLADEVREGGGLLAGALAGEPATELSEQATAVAGRGAEIALAVDAIHEGYLLHYAPSGRVLSPADPDLTLLAGDRLYALGLDRLAAAGDLHAVAQLAAVIGLCAEAHSAGDEASATMAWNAGTAAVAAASADEPGAAELKPR